ncbi:MAG TPA: type II secretion system protein [Clostridium sp.]|uniref:type II secretion system protein n=1 Tax=Clostridium sp. TaxID=1506 RepID=UPI002F956EFB
MFGLTYRLSKKGFTLIELMIVIAIIGLLSVVLIPKALPLKNQAKNNAVQANVYIVRSFLENRAGGDKIKINSSIGTNTDTTSIANALKTIQGDIGVKMNTTFSGSSVMKNPFNNNIVINSTNPNIQSNSPGNSSVVIGYETTSIPLNISGITSTITTPGVTAIIVYQTGYVVYGVDNFGEMIQPTLVNMPDKNVYEPVIDNPSPPIQSVLPNVTAIVDYLNGKVIEDIVVARGVSTAMSYYRYPLMKIDLGTVGSANQIINPYGTTFTSNSYYTAIGNSILVEKTYNTYNSLDYSNYKGFVVVDLLASGNGYSVYGIDSNGKQVPIPAIEVTGQTATTGDSSSMSKNLEILKSNLKNRVIKDVSTINANDRKPHTNGADDLVNDLYAGGDGLLSLQATLSPNIIYNADNSQWSQITSPQTTSLITPGYSIILSSDINKNINNFFNYRGAIVVYINYKTTGGSGKDEISGYTIYGIKSDGTPTEPYVVE